MAEEIRALAEQQPGACWDAGSQQSGYLRDRRRRTRCSALRCRFAALAPRSCPAWSDAGEQASSADRVLTFANGFVAREVIVDVDDARNRLAYSARSERLAHHHATFELSDAGGGRTHVAWIADLLPDAASASIDTMMQAGVAAMEATLVAR